MIQMPRRPVTRFAIPLIDVLLLLFCIFLLMEFNSESKVDEKEEVVEVQRGSIENMQADLNRRIKELSQFEEDRPDLVKLAKLTKDYEDLKAATLQTLQKQAYVRIIDIDGNDGSISFYDDKRPKDPILKITTKEIAEKLIERHTEEARGRVVYYYFLYPRAGKRFPTTVGQEEDYRKWFKGAANSLAKAGT
jgi:biopolymer transport protein ExbD